MNRTNMPKSLKEQTFVNVGNCASCVPEMNDTLSIANVYDKTDPLRVNGGGDGCPLRCLCPSNRFLPVPSGSSLKSFRGVRAPQKRGVRQGLER